MSSNAAMYAYRRANVAELNRRGRLAWEELGRLSGPELVVGTTPYRAGDRIVTLAPGAEGRVVTSECGTGVAVDVGRRELAAVMDDDRRIQRFAGEDLQADHLAHGYAVTVHRSHGATVARGHALEDGGGRELAYVKMSRAKECSTGYVVADSVEQAVEDLVGSWAHSRRIGWAIDRGRALTGSGASGADQPDDLGRPAPRPPGGRARGGGRRHPDRSRLRAACGPSTGAIPPTAAAGAEERRRLGRTPTHAGGGCASNASTAGSPRRPTS